jgi:hypothetical protein
VTKDNRLFSHVHVLDQPRTVSDNLRSNRSSRFGLTFAARGGTMRQLKELLRHLLQPGGHAMSLSRRLAHFIAICVM